MDSEKMMKEHNHDGSNSSRLNASNIEFNSGSCQTLKTTRVGEALKMLDSLIMGLQTKIKGKKGNLLSFGENDQIIEIPLSSFSPFIHTHTELLRSGQIKEGNIPTIKGNKIEDSGCSILEVAKKEELKIIQEEIKDINEELSDFEKNHTHNDYLNKVLGNKELFVIDEKGNLINTRLKVEDVVLKKDLSNSVYEIMSSQLTTIKNSLDNKSEKNHSHIEFDKQMFVKNEDFKDLLRKTLKDILNEG